MLIGALSYISLVLDSEVFDNELINDISGVGSTYTLFALLLFYKIVINSS